MRSRKKCARNGLKGEAPCAAGAPRAAPPDRPQKVRHQGSTEALKKTKGKKGKLRFKLAKKTVALRK